MRHWSVRTWLAVSLWTICATTLAAQSAVVPLTDLEVAVRLARHERQVQFVAHAPIAVSKDGIAESFPPGPYTLKLIHGSPAISHYRVFGKTFTPKESDLADAYVAEWKSKGYDMERVTLGRQYKAPSGAVVDTRVEWISFGEEGSETRAETLRAKLEAEPVWAWIREVRVTEGRGLVAVMDGRGDKVGQWELPIAVSCPEPVLLKNINTGFWKEKRVDQEFDGTLTFRVDDLGTLSLIERIDLDTYLQGVLPAEMPAEWPMEALKAQAVAARSEVIFNAAKTHALEGFDFCALEHCRAYGAHSLRALSTDDAIAQTHGEVITYDGDVVPTVFSATCGGWTEDNDAVWSGPAHPALRARPDFPDDQVVAPKGPMAYGTERWLKSTPKAFCSGDATYFRWRRDYTASELTQTVGKRHDIGWVTDVILGGRAPGGRLTSVTITGRKGKETVRKELPIRLAFGGLPSAMFTIELKQSPEGLRSISFIGGGRGHGVGLCQNGARGMALQGYMYAEILRHYFTGVRVERYDNDEPRNHS